MERRKEEKRPPSPSKNKNKNNRLLDTCLET
jgi:hypothetical protein